LFGCAGLTLRVTFGKWQQHADAPPSGGCYARAASRHAIAPQKRDELAPPHQ